MSAQDEPESHQHRERWVAVIASAYEIEVDDVNRDAVLVAAWNGADAALHAMLCRDHQWESSMAPYYVRALRAM